jgi:hypothetical protein
MHRYELSIWILEDYGSSKWILQHKVTTLQLFVRYNIELGTKVCDASYRVIAVHPEWNLIFLVGVDKTLIAYDMKRSKVHAHPALAIGYLETIIYEQRTSLSSLYSLVHGGISKTVKVHMLYFIVTTCLCSDR